MKTSIRCLFVALALPLLAGCAESVWAPDEAVARARYHSDEPPSITLYTIVRKRGREGEHSGVLINGSERVIFDPAGSWYNDAAPERNDVHFGMTPTMVRYYIDFHARPTYDVYEQKVFVSPEVAELALQRAKSNGAAAKAMCGRNVSDVLYGLPGFESVRPSFFPGSIMREFANLPGVETTLYQDADTPEAPDPVATRIVRADP